MVKCKDMKELDVRIKPSNFIVNNNTEVCKKYPEGTTEGVFCQVQNFPRIVVLNEGFARKKVLELNPCVLVGGTCESCGFDCCKEPPFVQNSKNEILPNPNKNTNARDNTKASNGFDPNPPYIPPPKEQIYCYNLRSRLNMCNYNKRNFDYRLFPYLDVVYP